MNLLVNNTSVPAGEYDYTASIEDVHGFSTNVVSGSYTIQMVMMEHLVEIHQSIL